MYKLCTKNFPINSIEVVQSMYNPESATERSGAVSFLYVCTNVCTNGQNIPPCNQNALLAKFLGQGHSLIRVFSFSIYPSNYLSKLPTNYPAKLLNHTSEVFTLCLTR